jgi:hypothetical protein
MSAKQVSQWRTVIVVVLLAVMLFAAFVVLGRRDVSDNGVKLFESLGWAFFLFAATAAGKSGIEHLAGGGGLKGAAAALLTPAKPEPPAPPPAPGT